MMINDDVRYALMIYDGWWLLIPVVDNGGINMQTVVKNLNLLVNAP